MALELFANLASTTVTTGGSDAPAPGTTQSWTVASSASFPAAVTGTSQFHIQEDDSTRQSEIILVTNVSGTTWSVTRGAEGTTPVAHPASFTVVQTITASVMTNVVQLDGAQSVAGIKTFTANPVVQASSGPSKLSITDGTRTSVFGTATATNDLASGSAVGDAVLTSTSGRIYTSGNFGALGAVNSASTVSGTAHTATGLTGATSQSRLAGGTTSGAPASGTFSAGDAVIARDGNIWVCTTGGSPGTWVEVGTAIPAFGAWTSYTPSLTQSGAVTKTVTYAKWQQFGKTVFVMVKLAITGSGTGANAVRVGLPVNAAQTALSGGSGWVNDSSAGALYRGIIALGTTDCALYATNSTNAGLIGADSTTMNVALASGDEVVMGFFYEAA